MFGFSLTHTHTKFPMHVFLIKWLSASRLLSPNGSVIPQDLRFILHAEAPSVPASQWRKREGDQQGSLRIEAWRCTSTALPRHWPELVTQSNLDARDLGKCALAICPGGKGNSIEWFCYTQAGPIRANEHKSWDCSFLKFPGKWFEGRHRRKGWSL